MKKFISVIVSLILGLGLIGCGTNKVNKELTQGKDELANKQYEQALQSFKDVLENDSDNMEAKTLSGIINGYLEARNDIEKNNMEEAQLVLNGINKEYGEYAIKDDINTLKEKVKKALADVDANKEKNNEKNSTNNS